MKTQWKHRLALAVFAFLAGGSFSQAAAPITSSMTLTGDYTAEGSERNANSTTSSQHVSALFTNDSGTSAANPMKVDMNGHNLNLVASGDAGILSALLAGNNTYINIVNTDANKILTLSAKHTTDTRAANGIFTGNTHLSISGPVVIDGVYTRGDAAKGIQVAGNDGNVAIHGPLTIKNVEGVRGRGKGANLAGIYIVSDRGQVTVDDAVDIQGLKGAALQTVGADSVIDVGGGTITAAEDADHSKQYYVARVDKGTISINAKDKTPGQTVTKLTGDIYGTKEYGKKVVEYSGGELVDFKNSGIINIALTTADSFWHGANTYQKDMSDYGTGGFTAHDAADFNLWLQNGAVWRNEVLSGSYDNLATFNGSHVLQLTGGVTEDAAGHIVQKDSRALTVDNYKGFSNVFYAHEGDGTTAESYAAGNTVITKAAAGSGISLITDNSGITMTDDAMVGKVLNALAGKLTYTAYTTGEKNLTGTVKIADGLTASSQTLKTGDITFDETTGKGGYVNNTPTPPAGQVTTDFKTILTGEKDKDTEYITGGVLKDDGTYKFTKDSTITAVAQSDASKAIGVGDLANATVIDASGTTLTLNGTDQTGLTHVLEANNKKGVTITADKLVINASSKGRSEAISIGGQGGSDKVNPQRLTINGDVEMHSKSTGGDYVLGVYAAGNSELTVNGNMTMKGNNTEEWGLDNGGKGWGYYASSALYSGSAYSIQQGAKIKVNGNVDFKINGNGLFANGGYSFIDVAGGSIEVNKDNPSGYFAIRSESGTVNMNVTTDKNGQAIGAAGNKVNILGNIGATSGAINPNEPNKVTVVNLGLNTKDSTWTGVSYDAFNKSTANRGFTGDVNLWLTNGATWTNEKWGKVPNGGYGGSNFDGSKVTNFYGGKDEASAGNIFQNDTNALSFQNYEGFTSVYYAHTGDGTTAESYAAGNTVITKAATGSGISLITDNSGITMTDDAMVGKVLNALAGKLTYTAYTTGEKNLTGTVKIADGLTASSQTLKTGDITFDETTGKGGYVSGPVIPDHQVTTDFKTPLTGVESADTAYVEGGVLKDGTYAFTKDSTIVTDDEDVTVDKVGYNPAVAGILGQTENITIDAGSQKLFVSAGTAKADTYGAPQAIGIYTAKKLDITAGTLSSSAVSSANNATGVYVADGGQMTVNGNLNVFANHTGDGTSYGVYLYNGGSSFTVHGDLTMKGAGTEGDGIYGVLSEERGGYGTPSYQATGLYIYDRKGAAITIDGSLDMAVKGTGISMRGSDNNRITIAGGSILTPESDSDDFQAINAAAGVLNMGMNAEGTQANGKKVVVKGKIYSAGGTVNVGLGTKDSALIGNVDNMDGKINLYLSNGGTWNHEVVATKDATLLDGSEVTKLSGGADAATAGNIFQNDGHSIQIGEYSGFTNVYYAHTGDGTTAESYTAGDTVITKAAAGSSISLITDNSGITMTDNDMVNKVLNALAGKLTYTAYTTGEKNLTGTVKIADGLTASSQTLKTGDITFDKATGKGGYQTAPIIPDHQVATDFKTALTGDKKVDTEYVTGGVLKDDGIYTFTKDTTISVGSDSPYAGAIYIYNNPNKLHTGETVNDPAEHVVINAKDHTLNLNLTEKTVSDNLSLNGSGIWLENGVEGKASTLEINAKQLNINAVNVGTQSDRAEGIRLVAGKPNTSLTINGDLNIMAKSTYRVYGMYTVGAGGPLTVNGNVTMDIQKEASSAPTYGGAGLYCNAIYVGNDLKNGGGISSVYLNGNIDIKSAGYGLMSNMAKGGGIYIRGGGTLRVADEMYAISNGSATITFNVGEDGKDLTGNDGHLFGNIFNSGGEVNVALNTAASELHGNITSSRPTGDGMRLALQNGASWTNTFWGNSAKDVASVVDTFVGGTSAETAGNLFQQSTKTVTLGNYSGYTNVFYAHTGDGTTAESYAAGDTVITKAAAGSGISLITDNSGITMTDDTMVGKVLNALAGKLTYTAYTTGEKNLTGTVKIADGLTASSQTLKTGDITFDETTGKGGYQTAPVIPDHQVTTDFTQTLTGDADKDTAYIEGGVLKDGTYSFTLDTNVNVTTDKGAAVNAGKDVTASVGEDKTLTLTSKDSSAILAGEGKTVTISGGTVKITGAEYGIDADGTVSITSKSVITGTKGAIHTGAAGQVSLTGSAVNGNIDMDGGSVALKDSTLAGTVNGTAEGSSLTLTNTAWTNKGISKIASLTASNAFVNMSGTTADSTSEKSGLRVSHYEGNMTAIYSHTGDGSSVESYQGGNTVIDKAAAGATVTVSTDNSGINMKSKTSIENALSALAQKLYYLDAKDNEGKAWRSEGLIGKVQISDGLTASSQSKNLGDMTFSQTDGKGGYVSGSATNLPKDDGNQPGGGDNKPSDKISEGDYETYVMKGIRSAATTNMHAWRDNVSDLYDASDLADEDGIFAKVLGGKTEANTAGIHEDNSYWGGQVGYDKKVANGWHTGIAFDYRDGDSTYLLGGTGDDKLYSLGIYAKKAFDNGSHVKVALKAGQVENDYTVYNEIRTTALDGKYKASAVGLTAEYGKTYGSDHGYFMPKVQMSWSRVGSDDYTARTAGGATIDVHQDAYTSLVGRLGFEAGSRNARGGFYAGLNLAHEFDGDINSGYYAKDGGAKSTSYEGKDTWLELVLGGRYQLSENTQFYADFARDFGGDFEHKWKLNAGLKWSF